MHFVDSYTDGEKHSVVTVQHRGKLYTGKADCHMEDTFSEFTGCRYAELRAEIAALKAEWKEKHAACEECRKFVVAVSQYANFNREDPSSKAMFRQLNRRIREVNEIAEEIGRREFALKTSIRMQDKLNQKKLNNTTEN